MPVRIVRIELDRAVERDERLRDTFRVVVNLAGVAVGVGAVGRQRKAATRSTLGFRQIGRAVAAKADLVHVAVRQQHPRLGKAVVDLHGLLEQRARDRHALVAETGPAQRGARARQQLERAGIAVALASRARLGADESESQAACHPRHHFVAHLGRPRRLGGEILGPELCRVGRVRQPHRQDVVRALPAQRAFEDVAHVEIGADAAHVGRAALVGERSAGRDDQRAGDARQRVGQALAHLVDGVAEPRLRRLVEQRQHDDRLGRSRHGPVAHQPQPRCKRGRDCEEQDDDDARHVPDGVSGGSGSRLRRVGIPLARHGADAVTSRLSEGAPDLLHALHQRVLGDHHVGPHRLQQFVLADDAIRVTQQVGEQRRGSRPQARRPPAAFELPGDRVEHAVAHGEAAVGRRDRRRDCRRGVRKLEGRRFQHVYRRFRRVSGLARGLPEILLPLPRAAATSASTGTVPE